VTTAQDKSAADVLHAAALRATRSRVAVLEQVRAHPHADVDSIATGVRRRIGSVSTQAVYDALRSLTAAGLLRRLEPAGSPARYEARVGDNHHHVVCRVCGTIRDVSCATGTAPCLDPSTDHGFVVDEAEVTFWGVCPDCQASLRADTTWQQQATEKHQPSRS